MTAIVQARALSKSFGRGRARVQAVAHADLTVDSGEIVGICGPSGSGKSTLLALLATIQAPTAGTLRLGGRLVAAPARSAERAGRSEPGFAMPIFQDPAGSLDPRWPLWRTITEPLTARHRAERPRRAARRGAARRAIARARLDELGLGAVSEDARPASCICSHAPPGREPRSSW